MRKQKTLFLLAMILTLVLGGMASKPALANGVSGPEEGCQWFMEYLGDDLIRGMYRYMDGYDACIVKYIDSDVFISSFCYPDFDIYKVTEDVAPLDSRKSISWNFTFMGCYSTSPDNFVVINDPEIGTSKITGGANFDYWLETCAGSCTIAQYSLTGGAKRHLADLPGKVIGKSYIRIRDAEGNLIYGHFTMCFPANGAIDPAFFRYNNGEWTPMAGYWNEHKYCMPGVISGDYVLVDRAKEFEPNLPVFD